jgi:hypothetical protein
MGSRNSTGFALQNLIRCRNHLTLQLSPRHIHSITLGKDIIGNYKEPQHNSYTHSRLFVIALGRYF